MASRQIYASSSGDTWDLVQDESTGSILIRHQPNAASGGQATTSELDVFLARHRGKAESDALLQMIGTLVQNASAQIEEPRGVPSNEDAVITRAGQLFEEETGRPWATNSTQVIGTMQSLSPGEDEKAIYIDRARREFDEIEEEGHS